MTNISVSLATRTALALFALCAGLYLLTASGHTYSIDEELIFGVTESLVLRDSFYLNVPADNEEPLIGLYSPGQSIAAVPLYHLGRWLAGFFPPEGYAWVTRAVVGWFNPLVTAATVAVLYLFALVVGCRQRPAIAAALVYGLATLAWPHSKTFFAEPFTAFLLVASLTMAAAVVRSPAFQSATFPLPRWHAGGLLLAGGLAGLAPTVKIQSTMLLPLLGSYVLLGLGSFLWRQRQAGQIRGLWSRPLVQALLLALSWGAGALLALGGLVLLQWLVLGSPTSSGYGNPLDVLERSFSTPLWKGLYGLIISPGKGIVWYAPPLLLFVPGLVLLWRRDWQLGLVGGAVVALHFWFHGQLQHWHGDGAWGPRYLNIVLPFLALPLTVYLDSLRGWRTPVRSGLLVATLLLAVPVQVASVPINFSVYVMSSIDRDIRYYQPAASPLAEHLRMVGERLHLAYRLHWASNSVALQRGFSYSEGNRPQGEQVPRWSRDTATIAVRAAGAEPVQMRLGLSGCRHPAVEPARVRVYLNHPDSPPLLADEPCPPRVYRLLLPPGHSRLLLHSDTWLPLEHGRDREDGHLGVRIHRLEARSGSHPLAIQGDLVPVAPFPPGPGPVTIRQWTGDWRYLHWDFWWWYLPHTGFPARSVWLLSGIWGGLALALLAIGGRELTRNDACCVMNAEL